MTSEIRPLLYENPVVTRSLAVKKLLQILNNIKSQIISLVFLKFSNVWIRKFINKNSSDCRTNLLDCVMFTIVCLVAISIVSSDSITGVK